MVRDRPRLPGLLQANVFDVEGFKGKVRWDLDADRLVYRFNDFEVPGDPEHHDVLVVFWRQLPQRWAAGLDPRDYPPVYTTNSRRRYHDNGEAGLCLWSPFDPPVQRWSHRDGLRPLLEITRRHLFLNLHWLCTGGFNGGEWLGKEAPHGLPPEIQQAVGG